MWFSKRKNDEKPDHDLIARSIAGKIVQVQKAVADRVNQKLNRYGRRTQLRWFWLSCGLALIALVCSVLLTFRQHSMPKLRSVGFPVHIGKSSEGLPSKQHLDSINHKK